MEDFARLLLDGTDSSSTNAGSFVAQETTKNNKFILEESGSIVVEDTSTNSLIEHLVSESVINERIILEDIFNPRTTFGIRLEQDPRNEDVIILDGVDSSSTHAGDNLELEEFFQTGTGLGSESRKSAIHLETTNIFSSEGQIPFDNWTLNSSTNPTGFQPVVHASEIRVRSTGDIA